MNIEHLEANIADLSKHLDFFVNAYREAHSPLIASLPNKPTSYRQSEMIELNGTPRQHAQEWINGVGYGRVTHAVAMDQIKKYGIFWDSRATKNQ
jgi:hypothetical protein